VNYDLSFVLTVTMACYLWAISTGDHFFVCTIVELSPGRHSTEQVLD